jgi:hypothetical protein
MGTATELNGRPRRASNPGMITRRRFVYTCLASAPAALVYGRAVEPGWLAVRRAAVPMPGRSPGGPLRLLHLSDLHASPEVPQRLIDAAVDRGLALKPDLAVVTGDFVTGTVSTAVEDGLRGALERLTAGVRTFAVLGNHDGGNWSRRHGGYATPEHVAALVRECGMELLDNTSIAIDHGGQRLHLVGVGDEWAGDCNADKAFLFSRPAADEPVVLLAHNPDLKDDLGDRRWDLMLSGHTHGGQICLPILGPLVVPVRDRNYVGGLKPWKDRWIHVSRGVGSIWGLRINCRPEITLLELIEKNG